MDAQERRTLSSARQKLGNDITQIFAISTLTSGSISIIWLTPTKIQSPAHDATWQREPYETTNLSFRSNGHDCRVAHAG